MCDFGLQSLSVLGPVWVRPHEVRLFFLFVFVATIDIAKMRLNLGELCGFRLKQLILLYKIAFNNNYSNSTIYIKFESSLQRPAHYATIFIFKTPYCWQHNSWFSKITKNKAKKEMQKYYTLLQLVYTDLIDILLLFTQIKYSLTIDCGSNIVCAEKLSEIYVRAGII